MSKIIDLPIKNKGHAIRIILTLWAILIPLIVLNSPVNSIAQAYLILSLVIVLSIFSLISYKKNNIVKAVLDHNTIQLTHSNKLIEVPLTNIIKINSGINNYASYKSGLSTTYKIYFNKNYSFGNCLHLKFEGLLEVDPEEIIEIKKGVNKNVC